MPLPEGLDEFEFTDRLRWTAVGRWHVRSGDSVPVALLDLSASRLTVFPELAPLAGYSAAALDGSSVWLFGRSTQAPAALYRVDAPGGQAQAFAVKGLPEAAGKEWFASWQEDVLAADGEQVWLLRGKPGELAGWLLSPGQGEARPMKWQGDVAAAHEMFATPEGKEHADLANGFHPADTLVAMRWAEGQVLLLRQFGPFKGVLLSRGCP